MLRRLSAAVLAVAVLFVASPAAAAPRPSNPKGAAVSLGAGSVEAGGPLRFTGTGWRNVSGRGQKVTVKLDDVDVLVAVTASDSGAISGSVTIPAKARPGQHWLRFLAGMTEGDDPSRTLASAMFTVTGAATATPGTPATLPKTGIDAGGWLAGAVLLPLAGAALLVADRRRRRAAA